MGRRLGTIVILIAILAAVTVLALTEPRPLSAGALPVSHTPDVVAGRYVFWASGCASCHTAPCHDHPELSCAKTDEEKFRLTGGIRFATPFGTFYAPNISPDPQAGIGGWSTLDFVNAMKRGISPDGEHYYPAFPYTSFQRMKLTDIIDLKAFLDTLAPISGAPPGHAVEFPFNIRRGLGLWKQLTVDGKTLEDDPALGAEVNRGRYLAEGPGHCAECHTPRAVLGTDTLMGMLDRSRWLAGAPNPDGKGRVPNITPHETGLAAWSLDDIAYSFESGFKPDFDTLGGNMASVQQGLARLTADDRTAIAAYLKSIPAVASPAPER
jgi:mono/diheme cytochrome c family protein